MAMTVAHFSECNLCYGIIYFKMVKMVNFMIEIHIHIVTIFFFKSFHLINKKKCISESILSLGT